MKAKAVRRKRKGGLTMRVVPTIEDARMIAEHWCNYAGRVGPFWCGSDGTWHDTWPEGGALAVKMGVRRSDWPDPIWAVVRLEDKYRPGTHPSERQAALFANYAEWHALRQAFPYAFDDAIFTPEDAGEGEPKRSGRKNRGRRA